MIRTVVTAASLAFALVGCGASRSTPTATPRPSTAAPTTGATSTNATTKELGGTMTATNLRRATGRTDVTSYEPTVFDEVAGGPSLKDIRLVETFSGDVAGQGIAHVVQATRADGSATFTGIERVRGGIGGKKGTFLLQVRGTVVDKRMRAEWFVVPGSGTGELQGLRGDGGFDAELGKHGSIWLTYAFE